jgi:hypothetical protein
MAYLKDLNIKKKVSEVQTVTINGISISIVRTLRAQSVTDLIEITAQQVLAAGYHKMNLTIYLVKNILAMYTDIDLTSLESQGLDVYDIYDLATAPIEELENKCLFEVVMENIDRNQYHKIKECIESYIQLGIENSHTIGGAIDKIVNELPRNAEIAKQYFDQIDKDKLKAIMGTLKA